MFTTRFMGNYLLFHSFAETLCIFITLSIVFVTYYTYSFTKNRYLLFLGLGYFWVAILDFLHTQTYPNMNIYTLEGFNYTLTFWMFARLLESLLFLIAPFMQHIKFSVAKISAIFALYTIMTTLFTFYSPLLLFVQESGVTSLKIGIEFGLIILLLLAYGLNYTKKSQFKANLYQTLQLTILFTILSELLFLSFQDPYGLLNIISHIFKLLSFWVLLLFSIGIFTKIIFNAIKKEKIQKDVSLLKERIELAVEANRDVVWDWNFEKKELYISERWRELVGFDASEVPNKIRIWKKHIHPNDRHYVKSRIYKTMQGKIEYLDITYRAIHKNGHWIWVQMRGKVYYKGDIAIRMTGTQSDVTSYMQLQLKNLQQSQIIEQIHDSVISTDLNGIIQSWNSGSEILLGYKDIEVIGQHISKIYLEDDLKQLDSNIKLLIQKGEHHTVVRFIKKSTDIIYADLSLSLFKNQEGEPIGIIGYAQDITQRKKAENALKKQKDIFYYQAHYDTLTQLPNRLLFHKKLSKAIKNSQSYNKKVALLFIDLDYFKEINDSLGHKVGDAVLKEVTKRLKQILDTKKTLFRLGGDEFTIIVDEFKEKKYLSTLSNKILHILSLPINIDNNILYLSCSIGISLSPKDSLSSQNLIKYADTAMYQAKSRGRNNFKFYNANMTEVAYQKIVMEAGIRQGIKNEEFVPYYQPQFNGKSETMIGIEVLVRWHHPKMGLLSPDIFIPIAQSTGLIVNLDKFVMRSAITQVVQWHKIGLNPPRVALNLEIKYLEQNDFIETFMQIIEETECKIEWVELEITEGSIMTNPQKSIQTLQKLNTLGIKLAIDDFGVGHSSLSYIKKLPIYKLKIDQSFIKDLPNNEEDRAITTAIITIAKSLNLTVLAEGVHNQEQKDFLIKNGCENIQGYLYSKALPAQKLQKMLEESQQIL